MQALKYRFLCQVILLITDIITKKERNGDQFLTNYAEIDRMPDLQFCIVDIMSTICPYKCTDIRNSITI